MAAGTAYAKRYAGGFVDGSGGGTPIDSTFLNAVETALLQLLSQAPAATDGLVMQWDNTNTRYGPALLLNKNVDPAAAIAKSKLDFTGGNGIVNADIAGAAAIAYSKLNLANAIQNGDLAGSIGLSKIAGLGLYRKNTVKAVNTSVAATDLLNGEITIGAGAIGATGVLRFTAWGDMINNSGSSSAPPRFQLVLGGTTIFDTSASGGLITSVNQRTPWWIQVTIQNSAAAVQSALWTSLHMMPSTGVTGSGASFTTGAGFLYQPTSLFNIGIGTTTSAVDTSASKTFVLNVINGFSNAATETKLIGALVEIL